MFEAGMVPEKSDYVFLTASGNQFILYDYKNDRIFFPGASRAVIWELMSGESTLEEIVLILENEYGYSYADAWDEVEEFLAFLTENRLLK